MRLRDCHNFYDFRELARQRLPGPIFDYIAGGADDEATLRQNTASFERCDLVPNVLRGVETLDLSVSVMGQKLAMPVYCSPTALQPRRRVMRTDQCAHCRYFASHSCCNSVRDLRAVCKERSALVHAPDSACTSAPSS